MSSSSPGARAVSSYEISDVFVIKSHFWVDREFNQSQQFTDLLYGLKAGVDPECLIQSRTPVAGGDSFQILRYFINCEVCFLKPGAAVDDGQEPKKQDVLADIKFVIAADYRCPANALNDKEAISAFGRNAYFHAWPYLREEVHAACSKLRIPRITLPMVKPDQAVGKSAAVNEHKDTKPRQEK